MLTKFDMVIIYIIVTKQPAVDTQLTRVPPEGNLGEPIPATHSASEGNSR